MPRAPLSRARSLAGLTLSFAFLFLPGCAGSVREVGNGDFKDGTNHPSKLPSGARGDEADGPPGPPPPTQPPAYDSIRRIQLESGPGLCAARRPDFAQSFVSLQLGGHLPPEESLLLREWIRSAWIRELHDEAVTFQPPPCSAAFLCLSGPAERGDFLVGALLRALSAPSQGSFYQMRAEALKSAEEWDRSSADWKLNTAARALRMLSPGTVRLKHLEKVDNETLLSLIDRYSGSAKASALPLSSLEKQLSQSLQQSSVTVASPSLSLVDVNRLEDQWRANSRNRTPAPQLVPAPEAPVHLEKDAPDLTQAALLWELDENATQGPVETALTLLVLRSEGRARETVRVRVTPAQGLYTVPAIRVDGPNEHVLAMLSELSEQYDRLISTFGSPSEKEWEAAEFRSPVRSHFEPRCGGQGQLLEDVEAMKLSRQVLRNAGAPTVVVWGTDTPPEPAE